MKILFLIFLLIIIGLNFISCGKETKESKLIVSFDEATKKKIEEMRNKRKVEKEFGLSDPADINDLDCFGLMVTYPELAPINSCAVDQGPAVAVRPDVAKGLVPFPGGQLEMLVRSGLNRTLQLIGFKSNVGCLDMLGDLRSVEASMSKPFIIGQLDGVELKPGEQSITMTASYSYGNTTRLTDCKGPMFNNLPETFKLCAGNPRCLHWFTTRANYFMPIIGGAIHNSVNCDDVTTISNGIEVGCIKDLKTPITYTSTLGTSSPNYYENVLTKPDKDMLVFSGSDFLVPSINMLPLEESTIVVVFSAMGTGPRTLIGATDGTKHINLELGSGSLFGKVGASTLTVGGFAPSPEKIYIAYLSYKLGLPTEGKAIVCLNENCSPENVADDFTHSNFNQYSLFIGALNDSGIATQFASLKIGEILVYNYYLTVSERNALINILKTAWGI